MESEELDPKEKLEFLAIQVWAVRAGKGDKVTCPYCGTENVPNMPLCCKPYEKAMDAVLARFEAAETVDFVDRVMDRSQGVQIAH